MRIIRICVFFNMYVDFRSVYKAFLSPWFHWTMLWLRKCQLCNVSTITHVYIINIIWASTTTMWGRAWATGGTYVKCTWQRPKIMKIALLTTSVFYNTFTIYEHGCACIYTPTSTHLSTSYNTLQRSTTPSISKRYHLPLFLTKD